VPVGSCRTRKGSRTPGALPRLPHWRSPHLWRTLIPESRDTLQTLTGVADRLYVVYSHAASHRVRIHAENGTLKGVKTPI
jgi:hypothetical protein